MENHRAVNQAVRSLNLAKNLLLLFDNASCIKLREDVPWLLVEHR